MTISIKPTASGSTIDQDGSTILTVDGSGNITPSNNLYPKVPVFRAYKGIVDQSLTSSTWTKVTYDTVDFDTNSNFSTSTSRFTPTIAGYYQINVTISTEGAGGLTRFISEIYKNGSSYSRFSDLQVSSGTIGRDHSGSEIVYFNGTTDYIEVYSYQIATTPNLDSASNGSQQIISGHLVSV